MLPLISVVFVILAALGLKRLVPFVRRHRRQVRFVATSVSAIPELVVDRVTGLLGPPNNPEELATCVQTLLPDQELAQQIAAAGKRKVEEEFASTTTTERLVRVYRERITASAMS
jgi:glycosyltransferase involved in cell wall biosynthesis